MTLRAGIKVNRLPLWLGTTAGPRNAFSHRTGGKLHAKPSTKVTEELSPLELLRRENELLRETINSADSAIEELEAQLQVIVTKRHRPCIDGQYLLHS